VCRPLLTSCSWILWFSFSRRFWFSYAFHFPKITPIAPNFILTAGFVLDICPTFCLQVEAGLLDLDKNAGFAGRYVASLIMLWPSQGDAHEIMLFVYRIEIIDALTRSEACAKPTVHFFELPYLPLTGLQCHKLIAISQFLKKGSTTAQAPVLCFFSIKSFFDKLSRLCCIPPVEPRLY